MSKTLIRTDGSVWIADQGTFRRISERLDAARATIMGLDSIYERWERISAQSDVVHVNDVAPSEDDRAVLTAALACATEEARATGPVPLGFDDGVTYAGFVTKLSELHQLLMTDVSREFATY